MKEKTCPECLKVFQAIGKRKYCKNQCKWRFEGKKIWRTSKHRREHQKEYFKEWYKNNKKKQFEYIYKNYNNNRHKWKERGFVASHKIEIWEILGHKCIDCGKKANEVNHLKYEFPSRAIAKNREQMKQYLIDYCKFLEPICRSCHRFKGRK